MCVESLIFNILSQTYQQQGDVRWATDQIPEQNCALRRAFSNVNSDQGRAIFLLVGRERANIGIKKRTTCTYNAQERLIGIAQHYRSLATIEESIADQRPNKMGEN